MTIVISCYAAPVPTPPDRKALSHARIVDAASRAMRRSGYAGVGVADVMREAGLTHGGFYAHFTSRDAMLVEAVEHAGRKSAKRIAGVVEAAAERGVTPFRALVESYLSDAMLAAVESGCHVALLCAEMPRQPAAVRRASSASVRGLVELVARTLAPTVAVERAAVVAATLIGSLQLARALGTPAQGRALLASARAALLEQYDHGSATPSGAAVSGAAARCPVERRSTRRTGVTAKANCSGRRGPR